MYFFALGSTSLTLGWYKCHTHCKAMVQLACIMIPLIISLDRCMEMANQLLPTCRIALFGNKRSDEFERAKAQLCSVAVQCC